MSFQRIKNAAFAEVRVQRKMLLIINILMGAGALTYGLNGIVTAMQDGEFFPYGLSIVLFLAAAGCGYFICSSLFSDMHNRQQCDITLSLPMTANERYFSKLMALTFIQIIPAIFWTVLANVMVIAGFAGYHRGVGNAAEYALPLTLLYLSVILFTAAVSIFWNCCCGSAAESIYFPIITAGIITALPSTMIYTMVENYARVSTGYINEHFLSLWSYMPLIMVEEYDAKWYSVNTFINCLISLAVIFVCLLIYRKRDGKTVGSPIVFKSAYSLMMLLGVFTVLVIFYMTGIFGMGLVVAALVYTIINIIVSRAKLSVKSVLVWLLRYAADCVCFIAVLALGYVTNGFGYNGLEANLKNDGSLYIDVSMNYNYFDEDYGNEVWGDYKISADASKKDIEKVFDIIYEAKRQDKKSISGFLKNFGNVYYNPFDEYSDTLEINVNSRKYDGDDMYYSNMVYGQTIYYESVDDVKKVISKLNALPYLERQNYDDLDEYLNDDGYYIDENEDYDEIDDSDDTADTEDTITDSETAE